MRQQLAILVETCGTCRREYLENVPLLVGEDEGTLTDAQVAAVLGHLCKQHEGHTDGTGIR